MDLATQHVDAAASHEHGYTGLSRARGETHLWVNTSRSIDSRCIQPHGQPAYEVPFASLVRQFSRSVVQPPSAIQGLAVENASDRQLHQRLRDLESVIRSGPLGQPFDPQDLSGMDDAIEEARAVVQRLCTSGTRTYVEVLERERQQLVEQATRREGWIEDHVDLLHGYTAVKDELSSRTTALSLSYQLNPPQDVLEALGPRPADTVGAIRWDAAVIHHAAARIKVGPEADLTDPAFLDAASWRIAIDSYHPPPELERGPALRPTG